MPTVSTTKNPRNIERQQTGSFHVASMEQHGVRELHITIVPQPAEHFSSILQRLNAVLKANDATIVRQQIFGPMALQDENVRLMKLFFGSIQWPISWVEGAGLNSSAIAGMHIHAVAGTRIDAVRLDGKILGCSYDDGLARHLLLGDIVPYDNFCSEASQTRQVYDQLETILLEAGMSLHEVIRTWFFLDEILTWYKPFNQVRNFVYSSQKAKGFPASTGVGVRNKSGGKLLLDAWAVQPLEGHMKISEVQSPLQCAAPNYGSGFSRAVEIQTPGLRRVLISGTASIDPDGKSIHPGDLHGQIEETMRVVGAILKSRGQTLADVTRATAYFKNIADAPVFAKWCAQANIELPVVITQADVCRDELLFEIEVDAVTGV